MTKEKQFIKSSDLPHDVRELIIEKGDEVYKVLREVEVRWIILILINVVSDFVDSCELHNREVGLKEMLFNGITERLKILRNKNT